MKIKEFVAGLNPKEVDIFWDSITTVPQDAIDGNWKYSLKRNEKIVPFKWFITQLGVLKNIEVDFQSNYDNRYLFANEYDFSIHEDLVFDKQDLKRFTKFYEKKVHNKSLFQFFIQHAHNVLIGNKVDPYRIRMSLTPQNEVLVIVGMRTVLQYKDDTIGFIIKNENYEEISQLYNLDKSYNFKGGEEMCFVNTRSGFIPDITLDKLLEINLDAIDFEYQKIDKSTKPLWNSEAKTTSHLLKKVIFDNDNVQEFLNENKNFTMEYFDIDGILKYVQLTTAPYDKNSEATKIFNDTRNKIQYLAEIISNKLNLKLENNYREKINKMSGQGNNFHNYKDYILEGYIPTTLNNYGKDIFIKIAFGFWQDVPYLHYQLDVNFKDVKNRFNKDRDYLLNLNNFRIDVDQNFPKDWNTLVNQTFKNFKEVINGLEDFLKKDTIGKLPTDAANNETTFNHPLNQILFGCPGSGKTYDTKRIAVEIANPEFSNFEVRKDVTNEYERLVKLGRIVFTTFHQSLSYEDFIEGIKPKTVDKEILYEVENGIFNIISKKAEDNWLNSQNKNTEKLSFEESFRIFQDDWEEDNEIKFPLKTKGKDYKITSFNESNLSFKKASGGSSHTLSYNTMKDLYYGNRTVAENGVGIYYPAIIDRLNSYKGESISKKLDNFVLIIDEINRGNVSSIFGELITLIEDDKRLGNDEKIEVILPYSKEPFGVPPNLYLIGTMNTADRSVESLDTALRRRFSFEEVKSNPKVIGIANENDGTLSDSSDINLIDLLTTINQRIELLIDKDHQIGHSYFIGIKTLDELKSTFKNKIIPLLEEYFYGDFGKIGLVLGDNFVETQSLQNNKNILSKFRYDDVDFLTEKKIYTFKDIFKMSSLDFTSIYRNTIIDDSQDVTS